LTGTLAGVSIYVQSQDTYPLHVAIRTVSSGFPTTTVLGDVTLSSNNPVLSEIITFPQLIPQVAGTQYAIVVNYIGAPAPPVAYNIPGEWTGATSLNFQSLYAGGDNFASVSGTSWTRSGEAVSGDLFFKTYVNPPMLPVAINVRPWSCANKIIEGKDGALPVAILSSPAFNAVAAVDISTLTFGRDGSEKSLLQCVQGQQDLNGDRLPDLLCYFDLNKANFEDGDTAAVLRARTVNGRSVIGTDSVRVRHRPH